MCLYLNTKVRTGTLLSLLVTAAMFSSQLGHSLPLTRSSKAPHIPLRAISIGMFDNSLHSRDCIIVPVGAFQKYGHL